MEDIHCTCGLKMVLAEKAETRGTKKKMKFTCDCGNTALVLYEENQPYDVFIKNPKDELVEHKIVGIEED